MSTLRFNRDELIESLEARRSWAERLDAKQKLEHHKAERAYLASFRAACREAAKWDYQTAKLNRFEVFRDHWGSRQHQPSCPSSVVASLDRYLNQIRASRQKSFLVSESGNWSPVHYLLTYDETIKSEMC